MAAEFDREDVGGVRGGFAITPDDNTALTKWVRAIWVGTSGDIKVRHPDGTTPTYSSVPVGFFNVITDLVYFTGTTASNLVGVV